MKVEEALGLLGLSNGPHKPIEIDKARLRSTSTSGQNKQISTDAQATGEPSRVDQSPAELDTTAIWDSLMLEWVYLPEEEVANYSTKELMSIRYARLLEERIDDFSAAIEADFPNWTAYDWEIERPFADTNELLEFERSKAYSKGELISDRVVLGRIARARFRALYVNPTIMWIEGTHLVKKEGEDLYRPKYPIEVEDAFVNIALMYGRCGLVNAFRLIILRAGICFDEYGCLLGKPLNDFQLTVDDLRNVYDQICSSQYYDHQPLGRGYSRGRTSINGVRSETICFMPRSLRKALLNDGSELKKQFNDDASLLEALASFWKKERSLGFGLSREESQRRTTVENAIRAICELDGESPRVMGIGDEILSPVYEAYDILMNEPACMACDMKYSENESFVEEFEDYKLAEESHEYAYLQWCHRQQSTAFDKVKSTVSSFFGAAILGGIFAFLVYPFAMATIFGGAIPESLRDGYAYFAGVVGIAALFGLLYAIWDCYSWPIHLWRDKRIKSIPAGLRWLLESRVIGSSILAILIGGAIGFNFAPITASVLRMDPLNNAGAIRLSVIFAALALLVNLILHRPGHRRGFFKHKKADSEAVRSDWERQIENHIVSTFPTLNVETNNRSIIKSRTGLFKYYEIDIWMPELKLGIEANGERYHDHTAYNRDVRNGTTYSREMYKEKYCAKKGITLIHVWSSQSMEQIYEIIDSEITCRM